MIRKTIDKTKSATFAILLPDKKGITRPRGTGFFISPDGYFLTAAHVVLEDGEPIKDIEYASLQKEAKESSESAILLQNINIEWIYPKYDIALLKLNFKENNKKPWAPYNDSFPFIKISIRDLDIAEPVYSFGYPLSESVVKKDGSSIISQTILSPRVTSAIISSDIEKTKELKSFSDVRHYVLDKALNYENSGGPIVSTETGFVHAFCSRFQPLYVPQQNIKDKNGNPISIMLPSLYGIVVSLNNREIIKELKKRCIPMENE